MDIDEEYIRQCASRTLEEDLGGGDITAELIAVDASAHAQIISREPAVLCGTRWADEVFRQLGHVTLSWRREDGDRIDTDEVVCELRGNTRAILSGERSALNLLQTLSATASSARRYADAVAGTGATVLDTRKTLPGLRRAQKYAVRCGGCANHRMGLHDAFLIKENHIAAAGGIAGVIDAARRRHPRRLLEIEVENLDELAQACDAGADRIMLDNFTLQDLEHAVQINRGRAELEASGGITLGNVRAIAATGVDFISVGALTKDVRATDFSLLLVQR